MSNADWVKPSVWAIVMKVFKYQPLPLILADNHPSGNIKPSDAEKTLTANSGPCNHWR